MMFRFGHAAHPQWREALELVLAQLEGQRQLEQFASDLARPQKLGLLYVTEAYAASLPKILASLQQRLNIQDWVGAVAPSIFSSGVEYVQEPALVVMLMEFPADTVRLFSGKKPLPKPGTLNGAGHSVMHTALVHVDPLSQDIDDLLGDLCSKMDGPHVFGGVGSASSPFCHVAGEALSGGLSGLVFTENLGVEVRMTQGVQMVGIEHDITAMRGHFIDELDHAPALDILLADLGLSPDQPEPEANDHAAELLAKRFAHGLFVGITDQHHVAQQNRKGLGTNVGMGRRETHQLRVRPVVGLDPNRKSLAIADEFAVGDKLAFCTRDEHSARVDLTRMCAELRDDLDAIAPKLNDLQAAGFGGMAARRQPRGALYIACSGRGASLFGLHGVEQHIVREQLGDIPLVGFSANGEVFRGALYGYTGVLALFF